MEIIKLEKQHSSASLTDNKNFGTEELVKRTEVKNTPFTIIEAEGKIFGALGMNRITEYGKSVDEIKKTENS